MTSPVPPVRPASARGAGRRRTLVGLAVALVAALAPTGLAASPAQAAPYLISQGKSAFASSVESAVRPASAAVDGDVGTRWASATGSDPQWITIDLGYSTALDRVTLYWEEAYARAFEIQTSDDGTTWTTAYATTAGRGKIEGVPLADDASGRYVRMYGTARATPHGYSLYEFQVYGERFTVPDCGTVNAAQGRPATASSVENSGMPASAAFDGTTATRWSSVAADPQWLQVDLGSSRSICRVHLSWEAAYARAFQLQISDDGTTWRSVWATSTNAGTSNNIDLLETGRYLRMYGTARGTEYGYSLLEMRVYVTGTAV
ncbi:discoidin domain-containing protein [Micromonospora sp. DT233]|uniref:discoidin domain-containing protein n=1 Tax=Micromonospora sp. DT233 TaxID=3393432 RepID=UPI003CF284AA